METVCPSQELITPSQDTYDSGWELRVGLSNCHGIVLYLTNGLYPQVTRVKTPLPLPTAPT